MILCALRRRDGAVEEGTRVGDGEEKEKRLSRVLYGHLGATLWYESVDEK